MNQNDLEALLSTLRSAQDGESAPESYTQAQPEYEREDDRIAAARRAQQLLAGAGISRASSSSTAYSYEAAFQRPYQPWESLSAAGSSYQQQQQPRETSTPHSREGSHDGQRQAQQQRRDLTTLTFPEALPIVNRLALDDSFMDSLDDLRRAQADVEIRMHESRRALIRELDKASPPVQPPARAQRLRDHDRRALSEWQALRGEQQVRLQKLGVPTFSRTNDPIALRRQARVMEVLNNILDDQ